MSDVISLDWIGAQLRVIQAEQRSLRVENELLRTAMGDMLRALNDRIGNFEALTEGRIAAVDAGLTALPSELADSTAQIIQAIKAGR